VRRLPRARWGEIVVETEVAEAGGGDGNATRRWQGVRVGEAEQRTIDGDAASEGVGAREPERERISVGRRDSEGARGGNVVTQVALDAEQAVAATEAIIVAGGVIVAEEASTAALAEPMRKSGLTNPEKSSASVKVGGVAVRSVKDPCRSQRCR